MAQLIPILLFRAWSAESHGDNSQNIFKTGSQPDTPVTEVSDEDASIADFGEKLRAALSWKRTDDNPFIFFSSSLLFAVQMAGGKKARDEANVYITCVETETATMANGNKARIYSVNYLLRKHEIKIRDKSDGSLRQYPHEYVALTSLCPEAGSRWVKYGSLIASGLFDLYPQLQDVNQRYNVRLHLAATDLRGFGFSTERALTKQEIDVAARLAFSFVQCTAQDAGSEDIEWHLPA